MLQGITFAYKSEIVKVFEYKKNQLSTPNNMSH